MVLLLLQGKTGLGVDTVRSGGVHPLGSLIGTGSAWSLFYGYLAAAALMIAAAVIELLFGVAAERQSLEKIAAPLSSL